MRLWLHSSGNAGVRTDSALFLECKAVAAAPAGSYTSQSKHLSLGSHKAAQIVLRASSTSDVRQLELVTVCQSPDLQEAPMR